MDSKQYDFAIIGAGAAGLQLALKMAKTPFFHSKQILILEKEEKNTNDRTWCFWEKGESEWDILTTKIWKRGLFYGDNREVELSFDPYHYKMIRSADFYSHAKAIVARQENFTWVKDAVSNISGQEITGEASSYHSEFIFDSRVDPDFYEQKGNYNSLIQHFKGWFIETETAVFDPSIFTMMDYRLKWKDSTSFTYILPLSPNKALVEFTLFNQELLKDEAYDELLKLYIARYLDAPHYKILELEQGIIPMSDYPFYNHHKEHSLKIGTGGGWVRASSGYSFKNADRFTSQIIQNIVSGDEVGNGIRNKRHEVYDTLFLDVLVNHNELGEQIFSTLYEKHPTPRIFRFLDGESSLAEDMQIIYSLNHPAFRKALKSKLKFW